MQIQITKKEVFSSVTGFILKCEKISASVIFFKDGRVNVLVLNASHSVFNKYGKTYNNFETALVNYKSKSVREILLTAKENYA
jgi:hypothetical protein